MQEPKNPAFARASQPKNTPERTTGPNGQFIVDEGVRPFIRASQEKVTVVEDLGPMQPVVEESPKSFVRASDQQSKAQDQLTKEEIAEILEQEKRIKEEIERMNLNLNQSIDTVSGVTVFNDARPPQGIVYGEDIVIPEVTENSAQDTVSETTVFAEETQEVELVSEPVVMPSIAPEKKTLKVNISKADPKVQEALKRYQK